MDVTPLVPADRPLIRAYGDGGFTIQGTRWEGPILLLPDRALSWSVSSIDDLTIDSLKPVLDSSPVPEFLLIGGGVSMVQISPHLRAELRAAGLVVDTMDTGAACRTWNVVLGEGRNAAAVLIPVE
jgi:uncharacterized protein